MAEHSPYVDSDVAAGVVRLLSTPLDIDGSGITAAQAIARELEQLPPTTVRESAGHLVAGLSYDDQQLERRRRTLGASEIPAVVGLDPYRSALDIYLQKRGLAQPSYTHSAQEWGLRLEEPIAAKYADAFPRLIVSPAQPVIAESAQWMSATPDRLVEDPLGGETFLLEIKNKSARQINKWGESGTDQVPFEIIAQATWQMIVTGLRRADIAVLFGGNEFRVYHLRFDEVVATRLYEDGRRFWFDHVEAGLAPEIDGSKASSEYLKEHFRQITEVLREAGKKEEEWMRDLAVLDQHMKRLESQRAILENKIKQAIGEDAGIQSRHGRITWKAPNPTTVVEWKAIAEQLRSHVSVEVYGALLQQSTTQRANSRRFLCKFVND